MSNKLTVNEALSTDSEWQGAYIVRSFGTVMRTLVNVA